MKLRLAKKVLRHWRTPGVRLRRDTCQRAVNRAEDIAFRELKGVRDAVWDLRPNPVDPKPDMVAGLDNFGAARVMWKVMR